MAWGVAEAKAKFSEVLDKAETYGPQVVRRRTREFVVMTSEEWEKRQPQGAQNERSMSEFFKSSPLAGSGLDLTRSRSKVRKVEL